MSLVEQVRSVLWARRRRPDEIAYVLEVGHERFAPDDAGLRQGVQGAVITSSDPSAHVKRIKMLQRSAPR